MPLGDYYVIASQIVVNRPAELGLNPASHRPRLGKLFLQIDDLRHVSRVGHHPQDIPLVIKHGCGGNHDFLPGSNFLYAGDSLLFFPRPAFNGFSMKMAVFMKRFHFVAEKMLPGQFGYP